MDREKNNNLYIFSAISGLLRRPIPYGWTGYYTQTRYMSPFYRSQALLAMQRKHECTLVKLTRLSVLGRHAAFRVFKNPCRALLSFEAALPSDHLRLQCRSARASDWTMKEHLLQGSSDTFSCPCRAVAGARHRVRCPREAAPAKVLVHRH